MKEVIAANANVIYAPRDDGGITPMIELIIITSEPTWSVNADGNGLVRSRKTQHTRQMIGLPQAYQLANQVRDIAADAEAESGNINKWIEPHLTKAKAVEPRDTQGEPK